MFTHHRRRFQSCLLLAVIVFATVRASAEDIVVMTSGAFTAAYLSLSQAYAASSGDRFITATTEMGVGSASIPSRLAAGESVDIVIVNSPALEKLTTAGRIVPGSRVDLAQSAIAMAVRKGAPHPDISSIEGLKRALIAAKSVAISTSVSGDYLVNELFPRLGIAEEMRGKTRRTEGEPAGVAVANGQAEIAFQQVSELRPVQGIEIVGPLPGDTQRVTIFSAGIGAKAKHIAAARAFLAFLTSPSAQKVIANTGLESVQAR